MKKIVLSVAISATLITAGCANVAHEHDATEKEAHGHHDKMQDHHDSMAEGGDHHQGSMGGQEKMDDHSEMAGHGGHGGEHAHGSEGSLAGEPGKKDDVSRVIHVEANDAMRFVHAPFNIKDGETIKFVVTNKGAIAHEFAIGTKDEHIEHGKMMAASPMMKHGPGGNAITIEPGESKTLIWKFENAWQIEAACNIPGHYQAGMHSAVTIEK